MKQTLFLMALALMTSSLVAADTTAKDDVIAAAKKLAEKPNYSWKSNTEMGGGNNRGGGPMEGKTDKAGYSLILVIRGENTIEALVKDGKAAVKIVDGWQSPQEMADALGAAGGNRNPGRMIARLVQSIQTPSAQATDLAGKTKELKKADDAYSGDLEEAAVKEMLTLGRRREGAEAPTVTGAKGSVKFWLQEGILFKMVIKASGSVKSGDNEREVERTVTVDIKDVGATKMEIPEDAKKKLS